ncbi:MAG: hypothetical protein EOM80_10450 [Erysipelotrichia bacterium]|nr:hypothetical protein [Erysipelotrichia bacterium]
MKSKNPETYGRNLQFLSIEPIETVRPILQKFFPNNKDLIDTLTRKDVDLMLMRILRSEVVGFQGEGEKLVRKARNIIALFGFLPPVEFFYAYNGMELFEAMLDRIYKNLKKRGKSQSLSDIWRRFSSPLTASFELKNVFTKDLLFKIRQRLKNYLEKDPRFFIDARSPKKLFVALSEWGNTNIED